MMTLKETMRMRRLLKKRSKKLVTFQNEEKSPFAHLYVPPLSPPSPLPHEGTCAIDSAPSFYMAKTLELADSKATNPSSPGLGSTDPDTRPLLCYPDHNKIEEYQLHRILTINTLTRKKKVRNEHLIAPESCETVALPYAEHLTHPTTEVTHNSDSAKKTAQILESFKLSDSLETIKRFSLTLCIVLEGFISKYKDMYVYWGMSLGNGTNRKKCT
ncbi:hypothetical protein DSO57_1006909 [Entomophthora muscae]|uniref:Uncharacterized protein n=1 Tax=Entomophthora muscae TaxID=34485 RepID=A0ACC2U6X0_9FUNG|nr:hypothetical protein DSO57_1006909 [Entomophthora muscae]